MVVAGVGMHPFGRFEGATATDLGVVAVERRWPRAREDMAGRLPGRVPATAYGGVASGHKVLGRLGMTGMPIVDVEAGCASGGAALALAADTIRSGQVDTALVFGIEKMPRGIIRSSFFESWQEVSGLASTPSYFALRAQRLMLNSGVTKEHLASVVVKNRKNGTLNPDAMFRSEVDAESVLASRVVCEPLHLWMLCSPNEGQPRSSLPSAARASQVMGGTSGRCRCAHVALARSRTERVDTTVGLARDDVPTPTMLAAHAAYEQAGVGPQDLDVVECQDTDAARELLSYEELGLCEPGGSATMIESRETELGGRLPVNPSGGLLSKGEPLGASALGQVTRSCGSCGVRPVKGRSLGHTWRCPTRSGAVPMLLWWS